MARSAAEMRRVVGILGALSTLWACGDRPARLEVDTPSQEVCASRCIDEINVSIPASELAQTSPCGAAIVFEDLPTETLLEVRTEGVDREGNILFDAQQTVNTPASGPVAVDFILERRVSPTITRTSPRDDVILYQPPLSVTVEGSGFGFSSDARLWMRPEDADVEFDSATWLSIEPNSVRADQIDFALTDQLATGLIVEACGAFSNRFEFNAISIRTTEGMFPSMGPNGCARGTIVDIIRPARDRRAFLSVLSCADGQRIIGATEGMGVRRSSALMTMGETQVALHIAHESLVLLDRGALSICPLETSATNDTRIISGSCEPWRPAEHLIAQAISHDTERVYVLTSTGSVVAFGDADRFRVSELPAPDLVPLEQFHRFALATSPNGDGVAIDTTPGQGAVPVEVARVPNCADAKLLNVHMKVLPNGTDTAGSTGAFVCGRRLILVDVLTSSIVEAEIAADPVAIEVDLSGDVLWVFDETGKLTFIDIRSGQILGERDTGRVGNGSVALHRYKGANSFVLVGPNPGELMEIDAERP